jgi:hypothetical protein
LGANALGPVSRLNRSSFRLWFRISYVCWVEWSALAWGDMCDDWWPNPTCCVSVIFLLFVSSSMGLSF